jgi:hypothetical protein
VSASVLTRDFKPWCASFEPGRSPINERIPWITFGALRRVEHMPWTGAKVFEYGSGGSSLFFLDRGCDVTTVEHDSAWLDRVRSNVRPAAAWTARHEPPAPAAADDQKYLSWFPRYRGLSFKRYVHALEDYPRGHFDVVLVDGRARAACLGLASRLVAEDGIVILDNSERPRYAPAVAALVADGWQASHFHGPGPYVMNEFWNTTVFARAPAGVARWQPAAAHGRP